MFGFKQYEPFKAGYSDARSVCDQVVNTVTQTASETERSRKSLEKNKERARRQTWVIAVRPAVCWVKHSALLECLCVCANVCVLGEGGWQPMRLHRGIVGSCLTAFLPLPGYKQCSTSLCLFPSFHRVCQAAHALQRPLRWLYLIISSENTKVHFWNSFICCVRPLCGWLSLYSVSSAAFG